MSIEQEWERQSLRPASGKSVSRLSAAEPDHGPDRARQHLPATADISSTSVPSGSLFHEPWWLAAVTQGRFEEVRVEKGGRVVGRLPFVIDRKLGFTTLRMPAFTHVLGPLVDAGQGKEQAQLFRRISIVRDLLDQLPRFDFFKQALYRVPADGLAFQDRGFEITPQFTFVIDGRQDPRKIWEDMHSKTRQHIRRAEEKFKVISVEDPRTFMRFYQANAERRRRIVPTGFGSFEALFHECRSRDCGEILSAARPDGTPAAMIYIVWGHGTMYYLLSSRADDPDDNGSVNLLIWAATKRANERALSLDLDGVISSGTASFLSGFGGRAKVRWIAQRASFAYATLQYAKRRIVGGVADDTLSFT